jgi:hypothetical protein
MKTTDDRYAGERDQFDLAIRLIRHQARTHIITQCTGFSPDRVRKLYATYFKHSANGRVVCRHRGKSPMSVEIFLKNPRRQAESSLLVHVLAAWGLLSIRPGLVPEACPRGDRLAFGRRFCEAYEDFRRVHPEAVITFEQAWNLLAALTDRQDLLLLDCAACGTLYVQDALALDRRRCPACRLTRRRRG